MVGRVKRGTERWRIVGIHVKKEGLEGILWDLERWADERKKRIRTIVGGDFNARTGTKEREVEEGSDWDKEGGGKKDQRTKNWTRKEGYW